MIIEYTCKICGRKGGVEIDDDNPINFQIDKWKKLLCCNRCADYLEAKRKLTTNIGRAAILLSQCRVTQTGAELLKIEAKVRERLTGLTKQMAALVCDYYRKQNVWEQEFVNLLMEKPDMFWQIVSQYAKGIKTI